MSVRPAFLAASILSGFFITSAAISQESKPVEPKVEPKGLILDDLPAIFVPARPGTLDQKKELEVTELFAAARAHESRREWNEAVTLLEDCIKIDPDNAAVLRRLSRLNLALGKMDQGVGYAKKVLTIDPDDSSTLRLVIAYHERRGQFQLAEKLLDETLANPKLAAKSKTALYAHFARGLLYAGRLNQPARALPELSKVMDLLDDKAAVNELSNEVNRILGANPANVYLNFGRIFVTQKNWAEAARAFDRGMSYNPDDNLLPVLLITSLLEAKKPEEALVQVQSFVRRGPQGREAFELLGRVLAALKKGDQTTAQLEELAKKMPDNAGLIGVLADRYRDGGEDAKAKGLYDRLTRIQPDPQGFGALAASLIKDGKFDGFLDLLARALTRPGGLESIRPQIESIAVDKKAAESVLNAATKRLDTNPRAFQRAMYNSLFYLARQAELFGSLVRLRELAVKAEPNADTYRELAVTYYDNGQFADAARAMSELMEKYPNERDRRNVVTLAQFQLQGKMAKEALATVDKILLQDPNDPMSIRMKCFILSDLKRFDEAIKIGMDVIKKAPEDVDFNRTVGAIFMRAERYPQAIEFYRNLLRQFPANIELAKVAHSGLSVIYVNIDDFANGEKELETLLKRVPDDIGVFNDLGYLYADQGKKLEEAETMIRRAVEEEPDNSAYLDSLGWVLFKRGKYEEALKYLEKAVSIARRSSPDGTLFDHIGDVLFRLKRFDKAKEAWLEAQKHIEDNKMGQKLSATLKTKLENLDKMPKPPQNNKLPNP
jgi:tetratricopeptide (TPR) repeat protein